MKVMCVMPITRIKQGCDSAPRPEVGDRDIVTGEYVKPSTGSVYYTLAGFPQEYVYKSDCFAIVPDDTADEVDAGEKEAIVNLETESICG